MTTSEYVPSPENPLLTVKEVAGMFSVTTYTVRLWLREGKLEGLKVNNSWRVPKDKAVGFANQLYGSK